MTFLDLRTLLAESRHVPEGQGVGEAEPIDDDWMGRLAGVVALQGLDPSDRWDALDLYRYLDSKGGSKALGRRQASIYAQTLYLLAGPDALMKRLPRLRTSQHVRNSLLADVRNPFVANPTGLASQDEWLGAVHATLGMETATPSVAVGDVSGHPFDGLRSALGREGVEGPLISVILCTNHADASLDTAVRSILEQTWRNLELVIVDDGTPQEDGARLLDLPRQDQRIRIIHREENGGAYRARNSALDLVRGAFVTFQDSDDWSHPRRLEVQIAPLLESERLLATRSLGVRADDELVITELGRVRALPNPSSLLMRVDPVLTDLGYFDQVRKGADNEHYYRIKAVYGDVVLDLDNVALALVRRSADSLSRGDFGPGWQHQSRVAYRMAYERWHDSIQAGASPYLPARCDHRPFPAPSLLGDRPLEDERLDVVVLSDWRAGRGQEQGLADMLGVLLKLGLHLGIAHVEGLRGVARRHEPLSGWVQDLLSDSRVRWVTPDEAVRIDLLMVWDPEVLQFPPGGSQWWPVRETWILGTAAPSDWEGRWARFVVGDCSRAARRMFGPEVRWVPPDALARQEFAGLLLPMEFAPFNLPDVIDVDEWYAEHRPWEHDRPRVGVHVDGWSGPSGADVLQHVADSDRWDLSLVGPVDRVPLLPDSSPSASPWRYVTGDGWSTNIDFLACYPPRGRPSLARRPVLEAMASGCVAIVPPEFRPAYGDGAMYANESEVLDVVRSLHESPDAFARQVRRGLTTARSRCQAFTDTVRAALARVTRADS